MYVVGKKRLEMVVKRPLRPVAKFAQHSLCCRFLKKSENYLISIRFPTNLTHLMIYHDFVFFGENFYLLVYLAYRIQLQNFETTNLEFSLFDF